MDSAENTASSEGGPSAQTFWRRSKDKLSGKNVKSMLSVSNQVESIDGESPKDELDKRQHRRAQVRKAQIEHRKRKASHVKELEQEVVKLRSMIAAVETEGGILRSENNVIKETLSNTNILVTGDDSTPSISLPTESRNIWNWGQGKSLVNISYDPITKADCLMISSANSPQGSRIDQASVSVPFSTSEPSGLSGTTEASGTGSSPAILPISLDQSDIAVNFILALEHPCRTHFNHTSPTDAPFDLDLPETGHELMASALLYSAAPASAFDFSTQPSECNHQPVSKKTTTRWSAPILDISKLHAMSLSLPKENGEVTPVQAWFMLVEKYGLDRIIGNIENLKSRIAPAVTCYSFGALIEETSLWPVAAETLGEH